MRTIHLLVVKRPNAKRPILQDLSPHRDQTEMLRDLVSDWIEETGGLSETIMSKDQKIRHVMDKILQFEPKEENSAFEVELKDGKGGVFGYVFLTKSLATLDKLENGPCELVPIDNE